MATLRRAKPGLGSIVTLTLPESRAALDLSEKAFEEMRRLEKIFNRFDPQSEVSRAGESPGPELRELLALARDVAARSAGAFTLHVADGSLDLGGIAKGFIVDKMLELLPPESVVNAGGDLRVKGAGEVQVEIRAPGDRRYRFGLRDGAVATSIFGEVPTIGQARAVYRAPSAYAGASVVAETCAIADAATKVALFGGLGAWRNLPGLRGVCLFDERGAVVHREG